MEYERMDCVREDMWKELPKDMTIAELGVWTGAFSDYILMNASPSKLYLVDIWEEPHRLHDSMPAIEAYMTTLEKFRGDDRVVVWRGYSQEFLKAIPELDCVYIDSSHNYEQTCEELELAYQKAKRYITGHDYVPLFGVVKAVDEFVAKYNLKCRLTAETDEYWPSFVICVDS